MITEPTADGQRTPLQEFETLYIGVATPAVRRDLVGRDRRIKTMRDSLGKLHDHDGSYRLGVGSNGTSTRVNDE